MSKDTPEDKKKPGKPSILDRITTRLDKAADRVATALSSHKDQAKEDLKTQAKQAKELEKKEKEARERIRKEEKDRRKLLEEEAKRLRELEAQRKSAEEGFQAKKNRILVVLKNAIPSPKVRKALVGFLMDPGPFKGAAIGAAVTRAAPRDAILAGITLGVEETKLRDMLTGRTPYDADKPQFVLQLLADPETAALLTSVTPHLVVLVDAIAPVITQFAFAQLPPALTQALQAQGWGSAYIDEHIRPIAIDLVKTLIADPETLLKVSELVLKMQLSQKPEEKQTILQQILESIDPIKLLSSPALQVFLKGQGVPLSHLVEVVLGATGIKLPLSTTLVQDTTAALAPVVGLALKSPEIVGSVYSAVRAVVIDDTDGKVKKATSLTEVAKLDAEGTAKKLAVITAVAPLLAQPGVFEALATGLPQLLGTHRTTISTTAADLLPGVLTDVVQRAEALATTCDPTLDRQEIARIITPPAVQFLAAFDTAFYRQAIPLVLDLVPDVLADTSLGKKVQIAITNPSDTEALAELFESVGIVVNSDGARRVFTEGLPTLVIAHRVAIREGILRVAGKFEVGAELVDASVKVVADALPTVYKILSTCVADPTGLVGIVSEVQALMNAPAGKQDKAVQQLLDKVFKFVEKNPDVKNAIGTELPLVLEKNSAALSQILDQVLMHTEFGKILKDLKTKDLLTMAAGRVPQLSAIAKLYAEGKFATMVLKVLKTILSDPEVLRVVVKIGLGVVKHKMRRTPTNPSLAEVKTRGR